MIYEVVKDSFERDLYISQRVVVKLAAFHKYPLY